MKKDAVLTPKQQHFFKFATSLVWVLLSFGKWKYFIKIRESLWSLLEEVIVLITVENVCAQPSSPTSCLATYSSIAKAKSTC